MIIRQSILFFLSFLLIWTELSADQSVLKNSSNYDLNSLRDSREDIKIISIQDFQRIKKDKSIPKTVVFDNTESFVGDQSYFAKNNSTQKKKKKRNTKQSSSSSGGNFNLGGSGSNLGGLGLVLIVVIGVVVVGMIVVAGGKILYDTIVKGEDFPPLIDVTLEVSGFERKRNIENEEDDSETKFTENGYLMGTQFSYGLIDPEKWDGGLGIALITELGHFNTTLKFEDEEDTSKDEVRVIHSSYLLIGAAFRRYFSNHELAEYLELELMTGTTDNKDIPLIAVGRASINLPFKGNKNYHWGAGIGGFYYDLTPRDSLLNKANRFETLFTLKLGYQF